MVETPRFARCQNYVAGGANHLDEVRLVTRGSVSKEHPGESTLYAYMGWYHNIEPRLLGLTICSQRASHNFRMV